MNIVTLNEIYYGVVIPEQNTSLQMRDTLQVDVTLTIDAESFFRPSTCKGMMVPTLKTSFKHVTGASVLPDQGTVKQAYWFNTRVSTNDGHTKVSIDHNHL